MRVCMFACECARVYVRGIRVNSIDSCKRRGVSSRLTPNSLKTVFRVRVRVNSIDIYPNRVNPSGLTR